MAAGRWWVVPETSVGGVPCPPPEPKCTVEDLRRQVHARLHAKDSSGATHGGISRGCHSYDLDTIVWETLALLGEWDLLALAPEGG